MAETQAAAAKSGASSSQPESAAPVPPVEALVGQKRKQPEGAEIQPGRVESVLLSRLECAICLTTMFPPIKQCSEGHNFCNKCANKLMTGAQASARKCPTCRTPLEKPVARARNLEQWATEADVEVTCDHDECGEKFPYSQYLEHKKTCVGCSVGCPLSKCSWRGEPQHLTAHLMEAHKLPSCPNSAKYSNRHHDYSTTVIFETKRPCTFIISLWKAKGTHQPFVASISALRKPGHEETPWSFDISLSAYPRPPKSMCVARASMCGTVGDLDAREVWARPALGSCRAPVLVADAASMVLFNTAMLDNHGNEVNGSQNAKPQRYELHEHSDATYSSHGTFSGASSDDDDLDSDDDHSSDDDDIDTSDSSDDDGLSDGLSTSSYDSDENASSEDVEEVD